MNDPILGHILYQSHSQSEAETAYDVLLSYVRLLEDMLQDRATVGSWLASQHHKPKWLQPDPDSRCTPEE